MGRAGQWLRATGIGSRSNCPGPAVREEYQSLLHAAPDRERFDAIAAAMRRIARRLQTDPHRAGEPVRHYEYARFTVRRLAVAPLYVEYAVHDEKPLVTVRRFVSLTPG